MPFEYTKETIKDYIVVAEFGLEKESLRVDHKGRLAKTEHPMKGNPHIERDFCENQVELITDVYDTPKDVCHALRQLNHTVLETISDMEQAEYLWPFSNPPYYEDNAEIRVASFDGEEKHKQEYREYLSKKYGKDKMLYSGIHLNFSFPQGQLEQQFQRQSEGDYASYKNEMYMELCRKTLQYSWLIVYLTAASPMMHETDQNEKRLYASPRCSEIGYWNDFIPILDFTSLDSYIASIQMYIDQHVLRAASELYCPVRVKPRGENTLQNLSENGINHLELRMLDLNPFLSEGIARIDVEFIHLLLIYLMSLPDRELSGQEQQWAIENMKEAAYFHSDEIFITESENEKIKIREAAIAFLSRMELFFYDLGAGMQESIQFQKDKIWFEDHRYAVQIRKKFHPHYMKKGIELAKIHTENSKVEVEERDEVSNGSDVYGNRYQRECG